MTDNPALRQALAYAARGWPVFPCQPGQKVPATRHGYKDATTDPEQITGWFGRDPGLNVAIATGAPGPDVLDVDVHGAAGNGYAALGRLHCAGLLEDAYGYVRTPSGGLHIYFTGTAQRNGHLAAHHVDFRSAGGYVLAPPSEVDGHPYLPWGTPGRDGTLSWERVCRALPSQPQRPGPGPAQGRDLDTLARWLAVERHPGCLRGRRIPALCAPMMLAACSRGVWVGWRRHRAGGGMRRPSRCLLAECAREGRVALGGASAHGRGERG